MKIAGFSFIRNAITYDYPIVEAIKSILPICDAFYLAVGQSEDETQKLIERINDSKLVIIPTVWDDSLRAGGEVLAVETNKAFDAIPDEFDWCFYIQGDEAVHEKYLPEIKQSMRSNLDNKTVDGLLFDYNHFYGSYDYIGDSRQWYKHEIRVIRNDKTIRSYKDAQGFRKDNKKLNVKHSGAFVNHYGWVKSPELQRKKIISFNKLWHDNDWLEENKERFEHFDHSQIDSLKKYEGTHPTVMQSRIKMMNWEFSFDPTQKRLSLKERLSRFAEKTTGIRFGEYKNYTLLKD